jgi:hypothetical protein
MDASDDASLEDDCWEKGEGVVWEMDCDSVEDEYSVDETFSRLKDGMYYIVMTPI